MLVKSKSLLQEELNSKLRADVTALKSSIDAHKSKYAELHEKYQEMTVSHWPLCLSNNSLSFE